jgi:ESCRT-I complex subunit TSG101
MSDAFSQSPPVYSNAGAGATVHSTPYPTNPSMPTPGGASSSYSYPQGYPSTTIPRDVYRDSIQTAVLDKVRIRLNESVQMGNAEIDSLRKTEQDLMDGETKIQSMISEAQQQQVQAQVHILLFSLCEVQTFFSLELYYEFTYENK